MKIREYRPRCRCAGDPWKLSGCVVVTHPCVFHRDVAPGSVRVTTWANLRRRVGRPTVTHATRWWPFRWPWRSA